MELGSLARQSVTSACRAVDSSISTPMYMRGLPQSRSRRTLAISFLARLLGLEVVRTGRSRGPRSEPSSEGFAMILDGSAGATWTLPFGNPGLDDDARAAGIL